ncbi:MAG TPA: glutamine-hydrolyzing GMP synthase [Paenalcaligenes sp.]|nr:glutamine-hydrolyzing GMP synthase [Paenalcaligenes sp.]
MTQKQHQSIAILDFGSQFTQLIARRIREAGVYCEILPGTVSVQKLNTLPQLRGIILSGSHASVYDADAPELDPEIFALNVPVLGICYGMQLLAQHFGGRCERSENREFGAAVVRAHGHTPLLEGIQDESNDQGHGLLHVWMSHGDQVLELPDDFVLMASTQNCPIAGMANKERHIYGIQFHPEVTHTPQGALILQRFAREICGCSGDWSMPNFIEERIQEIRALVGDEQVILGLSGGVDSSVAALLIHRAIGDQLTCVFVDHGLLRLNEAQQVMDQFGQHFGMNIIHVDASERLFLQLRGVQDPEEKRKIIGGLFVDVFQEEAQKLTTARWLAQGTIYPDVIESVNTQTGKGGIKSHHNVGGLPETLNLKLLEPLRELFKDEVRDLGIELGLPAEMVYRHPFPGPGLGVRILGEVRREYADLLRRADAIFIEELRQAIDEDSGRSWYDLTSQAFTVFLPVKSVGVMGDARTYEYVVSLRAVQTIDFMTADWAPLPHALLKRVSSRIINEVRGINRVVYDVSSKPPATIEWE